MTKNIVDGVISWRGIEKNIHVYKQVFGIFASCLLAMSSGLTFGYTAILLPQLQADEDFPYDSSYNSWIASISPLAMMFSCLFAGVISDALGRKTGQLVLVPPFILGWLMMAIAKDNVLMLLGRFVLGMCTGAIRPTTMIYIGEISDPNYRAIALLCPTLARFVGTLISHAGDLFYWRTSCIVFGVPNIICFVILLFLKESPLWLISKGKIDQGVESFKMFRGNSDAAQKELAAVLDKRKEKPEKLTYKDFLSIVLSKPFMKALLTVFLLFAAIQLCGVNMISFYALDIFKVTFSGEVDPFMLMLVTDGIRIVAAVGVCAFAKLCPRKLTQLICGFSTTAVLFALVIYLYLNPDGFIWCGLILMVMYVTIASAMTSLSWSFVAELFPGNVRGFGSGLSSAISFSLLFIAVKVTPDIIVMYGAAVMYAIFGVITLISTVLLCFILPETNGKTLQDIEDTLYMKKVEVKRVPVASSTV